MELYHLYTSPLDTNTYVVINGARAFVVDAGGEAAKIAEIIAAHGATLEAILLTHAHFDHIGGVAELLRSTALDDPKRAPTVFLHKADADKVNSYKNLAFSMGASVEKFTPDVLLCGGETLNIAGLRIEVIHTPGHSAGGVCYKVEDKIFVGDTLFFMSYGRTDFYDGDFNTLKNSVVNKLFRLKGNYTLLTGHGEPTTLDFERKNNPIRSDGAINTPVE